MDKDRIEGVARGRRRGVADSRESTASDADIAIRRTASARAGNRLDKTRTDALVPQPETGKIGRVHHPC
jgi:hypothetical protein